VTNVQTVTRVEERNLADGSIPIFNPSTGEQIATVPSGGEAEIDAAVTKARTAFDAGVWRNLSGPVRAKILNRAADLLEARAEEMARAESENNGMPVRLTRAIVDAGIESLRYFSGWTTKIYGLSHDLVSDNNLGLGRTDFHTYTLREPYPVAGLILPWNGPIAMACMKLAPALAAGCSSVIKPSEEAPLTTMKIVDILHEAGVPEGVVNLVTGYGHTAGAALTQHPGVDKISFTGSTEVGKAIIHASAVNIKRLTLELGGKSPVFVFDDADMQKAVPGAAFGIFVNSGQACVAGSRIFVHRKVYDQFVEGVAQFANSLKVGDSLDESTDLGPLISPKQLDRVLTFIREGVSDGVEVVAGGKQLDRPGNFVSPTVLTGVRNDMRLFREEIFGPVASIVPFEDEEEALKIANDTTYGLASAIWTQNISRAHLLAKRIEAGTVWVNCQLAMDEAVPFGGYKQSGLGSERGLGGIESYLQQKSVFVQL
jgi:phenylacetaldehyde dehydrogenase